LAALTAIRQASTLSLDVCRIFRAVSNAFASSPFARKSRATLFIRSIRIALIFGQT